METREKVRLIQEQIDEANDGSPSDFNLWRQKTEVVLRSTVGDASPLYLSFASIGYSLIVFTTDTPDSAFESAKRDGVRQAIAILEAAKLEVELSGGVPSPSQPGRTLGSKIFVVHGRNEAKKHEIARFLRALTGNEPVILHEQANEGRTIIEKFEAHAADIAFAVVLATADDVGGSREADRASDRPRPRQNVVFELGFFYGALGRHRVALLHEPDVERPSDTDGIVRISLDEAGAWKLHLARELAAAGMGVDWSALGG